MSDKLNGLLDIKHSEDAMRQALRDFIDRKATLHVPVQETDPDMVLSSAIKELMEFRKDTIKVSELREYLEKKLKRLSILRSLDFQYFEKFSEDLLGKFCEVKE